MADVDTCLPFIQPGWVGVEIGVSEGNSALALFEHGVRFLWLVDPWADYEGLIDKVTPGAYEECMRKLAPFAGRHSHLKMASAEAVQYIPPPVDFVWVDGNHRYEWVKSDLELYWPLIKKGGTLCGHDYTDNADTCQVKRAVLEFCNARGLRLITFPNESSCWVVRRP